MSVSAKPVEDLDGKDVRKVLRIGTLMKANPCLLTGKAKRPKPPRPRERVLTVVELAELWRASEGLLPVWRDYLRLVIALPVRHSEAARVDWRHLDLEAATWSIPGRLTKNGDPHRLFLHPLAFDLIVRPPCGTGEAG